MNLSLFMHFLRKSAGRVGKVMLQKLGYGKSEDWHMIWKTLWISLFM
uniref:Uncharacterized protein n=1 Tax=Arundo donax TaxID=35708 RepID=A0A0A9EG79_ARUDO